MSEEEEKKEQEEKKNKESFEKNALPAFFQT